MSFYKLRDLKNRFLKQGYELVENEAQAVNKIVVNFPQEKINFINEVHQKEEEYWKKVALDNKNEDEKRQL